MIYLINLKKWNIYCTLQYLMPFVEWEEYQLSSKCKLHPQNDLFRDEEEHKIHVDVNEWRCGYCKKIFRDEKFLDQHFDNRHYNLLNVVCGPKILVLSYPIIICLCSSWGFSMMSCCRELCCMESGIGVRCGYVSSVGHSKFLI